MYSRIKSIRVNRLFLLVYPNWNDDVKRFNTGKYYSLEHIIKSYNVIINGKSFYDQPINSYVKRCKEIRKLTKTQGEDYAAGCLLNYDSNKNYYRLIAVDLSRQKELDAAPKAIEQIEFFRQLKKLDASNDNVESMFFLTILEKLNETKLTFS